MKVAFYAPMKPPTSDRPSGDRTIARSLMAALEWAGHTVELVSTLRSYSREPQDHDAWQLVLDAAEAEAAAVIERWRNGGLDAWFTYHLFYKAPDLIGPPVCGTLDLPYIAAEASLAPKRAQGPWSAQNRLVERAVSTADHVLFLNPVDEACVLPFLKSGASHSRLSPFLPISDGLKPDGGVDRAVWARRLDIPEDRPWILAVGMMRAGDKLASYRSLAQAAKTLPASSAVLILVGDGDAGRDVQAAFTECPLPVSIAGRLDGADLRSLQAAADIYAWPAIGEAVAMATLEAMAAGLAVVSGRQGAVAGEIDDGITGLLAQDEAEMADALRRLIRAPELRRDLGAAARRKVAKDHLLDTAGAHLDRVLRDVTVAR